MERTSFNMLKIIQETFLTNLFLISVVCRIEKMHLWDFYRASSLKQKSFGKHAAALWHIILIPGQTGIDLSCVVSGEASYKYQFYRLSYDMTRDWYTQDKHTNYYTTHAVHIDWFWFWCLTTLLAIFQLGLYHGDSSYCYE